MFRRTQFTYHNLNGGYNNNEDDDDPHKRRHIFHNPWEDIWSLSGNISPKAQRHLVSVYSHLTATLGISSATALALWQQWLPDLGPLPLLFGMLFLMLIHWTRPSTDGGNSFLRSRPVFRVGLLYGYGAMQGWSVGSILTHLTDDPSVPLMALIGTLLAFISFTASAVTSERRSHLYLGGFLGLLTLILLLMPLAIRLLPTSLTAALWQSELYLGLLLFCFYILYDTQLIIAQAERELGDRPFDQDDQRGRGTVVTLDPIQPAANLFVNIVGIFVRLAIILSNSESRDRKKRKDKKSRDGGGSGGNNSRNPFNSQKGNGSWSLFE